MPGSMCQPCAPDSTGKDATKGEHGRENGEGGGEAQAAVGKAEW